MRLQRAMRGDSAVAATSSSLLNAASSIPDATSLKGSHVSKPTVPRSEGDSAPSQLAQDRRSLSGSVSGSALLSSLGDEWASGAAIRLRTKGSTRGSAVRSTTGSTTSKHSRLLGAGPSSVASSSAVPDADLPDRSLPRLRKVDTSALSSLPSTLATTHARSGDVFTDGILVTPVQDPYGSTRSHTSHRGASSASILQQAASPCSIADRTLHTNSGVVGRVATAAARPLSAVSTLSNTTAFEGNSDLLRVGRLLHQSRHRSSDIESVAAPPSVAASSSSAANQHHRDFIRHNIEVAGTYAPTRRLAASEEARLRALLGDEDPQGSQEPAPASPVARSPPATSSGGKGSPGSARPSPFLGVSPLAHRGDGGDARSAIFSAADDNTGFAPPAWALERCAEVLMILIDHSTHLPNLRHCYRLETISGRLTELSPARGAEAEAEDGRKVGGSAA